LEQDGCDSVYKVRIAIGYNELDKSFDREYVFTMAEYTTHTTKEYASVADPSKSCYENCFNEEGNNTTGILLQGVCTKCGEVAYTVNTVVASSSAHYFVLKETYECNGVRVWVRECPCGKMRCDNGSNRDNMAGVYEIDQGWCRDTLTSAEIAPGVIRYTCTHPDHPFVYVVERRTIVDTENHTCQRVETIYLNCTSEDYTQCEKSYVCVRNNDYHEQAEKVGTHENPTETEIPCSYYWYLDTRCVACGAVIWHDEGYVMKHTLDVASETDAHGNVTTTTRCTVDGCGYVEIKVEDADGNVLRLYTEERDVAREERVVTLFTGKFVEEKVRPTLERYQYFSLDGTLKRWFQRVYQYTSDEEHGCMCVITYTDHTGKLSVEKEYNCTMIIIERREGTCIEGGYSLLQCVTCGRVEERMSMYAEHAYEYFMGVNGMPSYLRCKECGLMTYEGGEKDGGLLKVMPVPVEDGILRVQYDNGYDADLDVINADVVFAFYLFDNATGKFVTDVMPPDSLRTFRVDGVNFTDDGSGTLSVDVDAAWAAANAQMPEGDYTVWFFMLISGRDGWCTYYVQL
jgi:hypothetical protein